MKPIEMVFINAKKCIAWNRKHTLEEVSHAFDEIAKKALSGDKSFLKKYPFISLKDPGHNS